MDGVKAAEVIKLLILLAILIVYNISGRFTVDNIVFSGVIFIFFIITDAIFIILHKKNVNLLVKEISELRRRRDLTKRIKKCKIDYMDLIAKQFNYLMDDLHNVIGQSVNTASQIAHDTEEIDKFSHITFNGLKETSSQIREISHILDDFSGTISEISSSIQMAADSAKIVSDVTNEENEKISLQISNKLNDIINSVNDTQTAIKELEKNANYITDIVILIQDIADQINLLALNAAIEAARAGEAGRGFAVVADEVRKLSEETVSTTNNIKSVVSSLKKQIKDSALLMRTMVTKVNGISEIEKEVKEALNRIKKDSEKAYVAVDRIASAVEEQSSSVVNIANNMRNIEKVYEEIKSNASKTASGVNEFNRLSNELLQEIGEFKLKMFGVVPIENAVTMNKKFSKLVSYLNDQLNSNYIIHVFKNYEAAIEEVGLGKTDFAYLTPTVYIEANYKYGVKLIGCFQKGSSPTFRSVIVVRRDSGIKSVSDLKGKKVAFGNEKSTGSTLIPMAMLFDNGLSLNDLAKYDFLGAHDKVAEAVIGGEFDAGGMTEEILEEFKDKGLISIAVSDKIPQYPICASPFVNEGVIKRLKEVLFSLKDTIVLSSIGKGYTGFVEMKDSDFDIVRKVVKQVYGKDFFKDNYHAQT